MTLHPLLFVTEKPRPADLPSWVQLLGRYGIPADEAEAAFDRLQDQYHVGRRYYHTFDHAREVVRHVELLGNQATDLDVVRLAAWYHDAVYEVGATDSEMRSAEYAREELSGLGLAEEVIVEVERLILKTAGYTLPTWEQAEPDDTRAHILLDADLAAMSLPWESFVLGSEALRKEAPDLPEAEYNAARRNFLHQFLDRQAIYYTNRMRACCEEQARSNLKREIARLS